MKGFISAIRTLTNIPLPGEESVNLSAALPWFPIVGLILGLVLYMVGYVWNLVPISPWSSGGALLIVGIEIWLTRGLHLDGLGDWADSMGSFDRDRRLAIMKDVSLGTFGVLALILAIMAKWLAFDRMLSSGTLILVPVIWVVSRGMLVELQMSLPSARAGEGMAGPFVEGASNTHRLVSHILTLGICLVFGPVGLALFILAWVMTKIFGARCRKKFGGITGDLLGTANEMTVILLLVICALPGQRILCYIGWAELLRLID